MRNKQHGSRKPGHSKTGGKKTPGSKVIDLYRSLRGKATDSRSSQRDRSKAAARMERLKTEYHLLGH